MNIASTYKLMHEVSKAWDVYKTTLAREMSNSVRFQGPTYLTIAQAGLDGDDAEQSLASRKAFLDVSLSIMSSNYYRSIISGVLLLGFECANHDETRTVATSYLEGVGVSVFSFSSHTDTPARHPHPHPLLSCTTSLRIDHHTNNIDLPTVQKAHSQTMETIIIFRLMNVTEKCVHWRIPDTSKTMFFRFRNLEECS